MVFTATVKNTTDAGANWSVSGIPGGSAASGPSLDGVPRFRPGEEVYLFLWARDGEPYRVLGWSLGTFRIVRNPDSGLETVTQDSTATPVFDPRTHAFHRPGIRNLPVAVFRERIHKALRRQDE